MDLASYGREPARREYTTWSNPSRCFPALEKSYHHYQLPEAVAELAQRVSAEFELEGPGRVKNPDGRIQGAWDGEHLSATAARMEGGQLVIEVSRDPVRVSEDLAASHLALLEGAPERSVVYSLGSYVEPVVVDSAGRPSVLVTRRPSTALLHHDSWDGLGGAVPVGLVEPYPTEIAGRLQREHGVTVRGGLRPLWTYSHRIANILLPSGYAEIGEADVANDLPDGAVRPRPVPFVDFARFVETEAPWREWNYPGFLAVCDTIVAWGFANGRQEFIAVGSQTAAREADKLARDPVPVRSVLQNLGIA